MRKTSRCFVGRMPLSLKQPGSYNNMQKSKPFPCQVSLQGGAHLCLCSPQPDTSYSARPHGYGASAWCASLRPMQLSTVPSYTGCRTRGYQPVTQSPESLYTVERWPHWINAQPVAVHHYTIGNESVPIQLAQCWFPGLDISNSKIQIYFSNKIYRSNFITQHSETVVVWNYQNADCS